MGEKSDCRLCGGATSRQFTLKVLRKHVVAYWKCLNCQSLQTDSPYWLEEAYATSLSALDTGVAQRVLQNLAVTWMTCKILRLAKVLDFGGGDGLLCRLLRDHGLDCFVSDRYEMPTRAQGFSHPPFSSPDLLTAFEVIEHFPNPATELSALFDKKPQAILLSTAPYQDQTMDWWYLAPQSGQHIFFYSLKAMQGEAQKNGYYLIARGEYWMMVREPSPNLLKRLLLNLILRPKIIRIGRALLQLLPTPGVARDHSELAARTR